MKDPTTQGAAGSGIPAEATPEKTFTERLAYLSRGPVELECRRYAEAIGERDLSVSGRLENAAELCKMVRQWLATHPETRPIGTEAEFNAYLSSYDRLPAERLGDLRIEDEFLRHMRNKQRQI